MKPTDWIAHLARTLIMCALCLAAGPRQLIAQVNGHTPRAAAGLEPVASMPTARVWGTALAWKDRVYVINGLSGWGEGAHWVNAVETYHPEQNRWEIRTSSPSEAGRYVPALANGSLHLYAGKEQGNSYRYSPQDNTWRAETDMRLPWEANQNTGVIEVAGRLFALKTVWGDGDWVGSFAEYDASRSEWIPRRSPPMAAPGPQMTSMDGRLYLVGAGKRCDGLEEYDARRDMWITRSPLPTGRVEVRVAAFKGRIYAVGGHTVGEGVTLNTVEEYDPAHDRWSVLPPLPEARWGVGIAAIDGRLYVFGGGPDAVGSAPASSKVWVYVPAN